MVNIALEQYTTVNNRQQLIDRITSELQRGARHFVLDLSGTAYLDTAALSTLVGLTKRIREQGGDLRLVNPNADLHLLLDVIKLSAFFKIPERESTPPTMQ